MIELAAAAAKSTSAWDEPGTLAFLVIFAMGVVLYFVFRSLARHLRKINEAARLEAAQSGLAEDGAMHSETSLADGWLASAGPAGQSRAHETQAGAAPSPARPPSE